MMSYDVVEKAILLESNYLLGHQKGGVELKPDTIREVVSFYIQLRETFQFKFDYSSLTKDLSHDDTTRLAKEMGDWSKENNILMFGRRVVNINYFSSEEDVSAFKLRWL